MLISLLVAGISQTAQVFAVVQGHLPGLKVQRDLAYGPEVKDKKLITKLDVYYPVADSKHPMVIYIHGGAWAKGDKGHVGLKPEAFAKQGFTLVSVNYRLFPDATFREQASDIASAIAWVRARADQLHSSAEQIYLMGHSAGAHLAALVATDEQYLKSASLSIKAIKGVVLLDGAGYDIPRQVEKLSGPRNRRMYQKIFGTDSAVLKEASPITHIAKGKGIPPFLLIHIASRRNSRLQSEGLAAALKKAGVAATVISARNKTHRSLNQDLGKTNDPPTRAVFDFLSRQEKLKNAEKR